MPQTIQMPSLGRVVHYNHKGKEWQAAFVVHVHELAKGAIMPLVNITVWNSGGTQRTVSLCAFGEGEGQWRWPPHVPSVVIPDPPTLR